MYKRLGTEEGCGEVRGGAYKKATLRDPCDRTVCYLDSGGRYVSLQVIKFCRTKYRHKQA